MITSNKSPWLAFCKSWIPIFLYIHRNQALAKVFFYCYNHISFQFHINQFCTQKAKTIKVWLVLKPKPDHLFSFMVAIYFKNRVYRNIESFSSLLDIVRSGIILTIEVEGQESLLKLQKSGTPFHKWSEFKGKKTEHLASAQEETLLFADHIFLTACSFSFCEKKATWRQSQHVLKNMHATGSRDWKNYQVGFYTSLDSIKTWPYTSKCHISRGSSGAIFPCLPTNSSLQKEIGCQTCDSKNPPKQKYQG